MSRLMVAPPRRARCGKWGPGTCSRVSECRCDGLRTRVWKGCGELLAGKVVVCFTFKEQQVSREPTGGRGSLCIPHPLNHLSSSGSAASTALLPSFLLPNATNTVRCRPKGHQWHAMPGLHSCWSAINCMFIAAAHDCPLFCRPWPRPC